MDVLRGSNIDMQFASLVSFFQIRLLGSYPGLEAQWNFSSDLPDSWVSIGHLGVIETDQWEKQYSIWYRNHITILLYLLFIAAPEALSHP